MLANATVVAFVLHCNSRFNFHCHTQREAMSTQKWARKWQLWPFVTSCVKDYEGHSFVQTSFTKLPSRYMHCTQGKAYSVSQYFMSVHSMVILDPPPPPPTPLKKKKMRTTKLYKNYSNLLTGLWIISLTVEVIIYISFVQNISYIVTSI